MVSSLEPRSIIPLLMARPFGTSSTHGLISVEIITRTVRIISWFLRFSTGGFWTRILCRYVSRLGIQLSLYDERSYRWWMSVLFSSQGSHLLSWRRRRIVRWGVIRYPRCRLWWLTCGGQWRVLVGLRLSGRLHMWYWLGIGIEYPHQYLKLILVILCFGFQHKPKQVWNDFLFFLIFLNPH